MADADCGRVCAGSPGAVRPCRVGRIELAQRTGMMTFPQVVVGDRLVGGFSETQAAAENGQLERLLAA